MRFSAVGVDIIEIERVRRVLKRHPERFLERVFTPEEVAYCRGRISELAARFAAKEAVMKALGTGARGVAWREIEILPDNRGKPLIYLYGGAERRAREIGLDGLDVSLSHSRDSAVAMVVGHRDPVSEEQMTQWRSQLIKRLKSRGLLS
jgi:holo-[acyl-carrier protein] synthase